MKIFVNDGIISKLPTSFEGLCVTVHNGSIKDCYRRLKQILEEHPGVKPTVIVSTSYSPKDKFGLIPLNYLKQQKQKLKRKFLHEFEKNLLKISKLVNKRNGIFAMASLIPFPKDVSPEHALHGEEFRRFCLTIVELCNETIWAFNGKNEVLTPNVKMCLEHKSHIYPNSSQKKIKIGCFAEDNVHLKRSFENKCANEILRVFQTLEDN